jgi:diguanylate cyclase (GGDEF)-like protein
VVLESGVFAATPARCLLTDPRGRLWIGTDKGLQRFDAQSKTLSAVENVDPVPVNALAVDPRDADSLWIGTDLGLFNLRANEVAALPATSGVAIESLFFDRRGTLWVGTETGLVSMGEQTLTLHASDLPATLDAVLDITQLASGQILATTRNHGLIASSPDGWLQYTERQGLPKSSITDIELYGDQAWLVSSAGLFRFDATQIQSGASQLDVRAIISLDNYRPLHVDLCCSGERDASAAQDNGTLIITTRDGIMQMDMKRPDARLPEPRPYVRAVVVNDETTLQANAQPIKLSRKTDRVRIDYSALSLDQGGRLIFRYRLRGSDDAWLNMGAARTAHLANLPVGDFTFELQASVLPGIWSQATSTLQIQRTPEISETLLFRAALWLASVGLVAGLIWLRSAVARRRHRVLEARIQERTRALRSVNEQLENRNQDLRRASETDALTGLLNRRYFDTRQRDDELDASLSDQGVLIMIDIDHFKRINDTWGHGAGDAVLRQFADVLRAATRESDVVARWGGEEFMLLCRCQKSHAPVLLNRIVDAVRDHAFSLDNGDHINVHSSLGAVLYPLWPGHSMDDRLGVLLELADAALYRVKSCGRDGWALLGGANPPHTHLRIKRAGPLLSSLVSDGHLIWSASRETINPDAAVPATGTG